MHSQNNEGAPVGVVPRARAQSIQTLMSDAPETCTLAETAASPPAGRRIPPLPHWVSAVASLGAVAAALDWIKLPR